MKYDYLVVGSGLYGAIFAHEAKVHGKSVLVVDKRPNIAGNIYTENIEGINVHKYGAHIFHTNNKKVWNYITRFAEFNRFTNSPVANYKGELYSLPFNMYTFNKMWGVVTPEEAAAKIEEQRREITHEPQNLEEQAISLVGRDIYEKLIKGYTEKQWGRDCKDLPAFIIKRLPVRLTFDNNYFNALYQGIPIGGYTKMIANLLDGIEVRLNTDYLENKAALDALADKIVYTGPIDAYFDYKLGTLEYRSVRFENELLDKPSFQGNAAVNYTDRETPWTRIICKTVPTAKIWTARTRTATTCPKRSSAASIPPSGSPVTSRITPSTMLKTARCMPSTRSWPTPSRRSSSADAWVSTSITTWIRSSPPCWTAVKASCTKVQPSEGTKSKRQQSRPQKLKSGFTLLPFFICSIRWRRLPQRRRP